VDACTVTALDAITAFAVPNPNCPSQSRRFFQVWLLFGSPRRANHSAYFGLAKFFRVAGPNLLHFAPVRNYSLLDTCTQCYTRIAPWLTLNAGAGYG